MTTNPFIPAETASPEAGSENKTTSASAPSAEEPVGLIQGEENWDQVWTTFLSTPIDEGAKIMVDPSLPESPATPPSDHLKLATHFFNGFKKAKKHELEYEFVECFIRELYNEENFNSFGTTDIGREVAVKTAVACALDECCL